MSAPPTSGVMSRRRLYAYAVGGWSSSAFWSAAAHRWIATGSCLLLLAWLLVTYFVFDQGRAA